MAGKQPEEAEVKASKRRWKLGSRSATATAEPRGPAPLSPIRRLASAARRRYSRADIMLFASGIALSAVCAFFPWYVFFNQQQFGVRGVKMDMPSSGSISTGVGPAGRNVGPIPDLAREGSSLDTFTTGTLAEPGEQDEENSTAAVEQPFPAPVQEFELVHIANGRAMIQDDMGLFVVQRGSLLPDNTKVASIEQRDGRWVVVTSADRVLEIKSK